MRPNLCVFVSAVRVCFVWQWYKAPKAALRGLVRGRRSVCIDSSCMGDGGGSFIVVEAEEGGPSHVVDGS